MNTSKNRQESDRTDLVGTLTLVHLVTLLILMWIAWPVLAQNDESASTDPVPDLDLFDEDVETTHKGWPQLYAAAGIMYLDADGVFSARLPNGNEATIIDFDRADWRNLTLRTGCHFTCAPPTPAGVRGLDPGDMR